MSQELLKQLRESKSVELPESGGNGKGTATCYKVEARMSIGCGPKAIAGTVEMSGRSTLTDTEWKTLCFPQGSPGVPPAKYMQEYANHGFLSYQAAQALRWWFLAEQNSTTGLETRLMEYKFEYSYSATPVRAVCLIDPEQREDIMPDWGKK